MNDQELQDLIKLKRYEQPEEGYFESFLEEFHDRQRSEVLTGSARGLLMERVGVWFSQLGAMRWAAGAGLAYAAVAVVIFLNKSDDVASAQVANQIVPVVEFVEVDSGDMAIVPVSMVYLQPMDFSGKDQPVADVSEHLF